MNGQELMNDLRFQVERLEVAVEMENSELRRTTIGSTCEHIRNLLDQLAPQEKLSARRTGA